jgi:hypothetical protein
LAKFDVATDKQLIVRGSLVKVSAGEVETEDADLIKALLGAQDVEEVKPKKGRADSE